jgi:aspartate oxidase
VQRLFDTDDAHIPAPPAASEDAMAPPPPVTNGAAPQAPALREVMWSQVGIVRDRPGLADAVSRLTRWAGSVPVPHDRPGAELSSLVTCARIAASAALCREKSRGAHFRTDFDHERPEWQRHLVFRQDGRPVEFS